MILAALIPRGPPHPAVVALPAFTYIPVMPVWPGPSHLVLLGSEQLF